MDYITIFKTEFSEDYDVRKEYVFITMGIPIHFVHVTKYQILVALVNWPSNDIFLISKE